MVLGRVSRGQPPRTRIIRTRTIEAAGQRFARRWRSASTSGPLSPFLMRTTRDTPDRGTRRSDPRSTLAAMNDPWLPLIAALSGQRTTTPATWPSCRVHRLLGYLTEERHEARPERRRPAAPTPAPSA